MSTYWLSSLAGESFEPLPVLPAECDVVVIGGGVMGVSAAYWLARSGKSVTLIERRQLCWGATGRNAGLLLPNSSQLEDTGLLRRVLAEEDIDAQYAAPGHLALASSEEVWSAFQREARSSQARGGRIEALDREQCGELLGLRISDRLLGGRWFPGGGRLHSARWVHGLARAAERRGAVISVRTSALQIRPSTAARGLRIHTDRGVIDTDFAVCAAGSESHRWVPGLERVLAYSAAQVLATPPLPALFRVGLGVDFGRVFWNQARDGCVVLGGGACPTEAHGVDEAPVEPDLQHRLTAFLARCFPDLPPLEAELRWTGVMDEPEDGKPVVGPLPSQPRVWVMAGFGGHGMPSALAVGAAVTDSLASGVVSELLTAFRPARFPELN